MVWVVPVMFGFALALASMLVRGHRESSMLSGHLWAVWALANAAWLANMLWLLPVLDLGLGVVLINLWWTTRARWVALLVHAVVIRLVLHVLDALTGHLFFVAYAHALNATFVWMIVVVADAGGDHGSRYFRDLLCRFRRMGRAEPLAPQWRLKHGC